MRLSVALVLLAVACTPREPPSESSPPTSPKADLILKGGAVYTVDAARSWARAVAVAGGRIVYAGTDAGVEAFRGPQTRTVDLEGRMLLPGFHDAHVHPLTGGVEASQCDLNNLGTREEIFAAITAYAKAHPERPWIVGGGWDLPLFPNANPGRGDLDRLVPDRPVYLSAADGHSAWVSSRALALANIDASTADPPNGRIEREPGTRVPSGTLREDAMELVEAKLPETSDAERLDGLRRGLQMAARFGITSLHEASARIGTVLPAYAELERRGELTARVRASLWVDPKRGTEQVAELVAARERYRSERLRPEAAKIFLDGVIEARTAALLAPYLDPPGHVAKLNLERPALDDLVAALDREGFQVHMHAIGDAAVRAALDAVAAAQERNGRSDRRHQIAHLQLIDPIDVPRFAALGVAASFQPLWAFADSYITELTEPTLGPERSRWLYPIGSVAASGAILAAGSDWSVTSMNPLEAIQVALTRQAVREPRGEPWLPEQRIDLPAALAAYTIGGAWAAHQDDLTGSIEVGKAADLVVLDRNLFTTPVHELYEVNVLLTLVAGEEVYRAPGLGPSLEAAAER